MLEVAKVFRFRSVFAGLDTPVGVLVIPASAALAVCTPTGCRAGPLHWLHLGGLGVAAKATPRLDCGGIHREHCGVPPEIERVEARADEREDDLFAARTFILVEVVTLPLPEVETLAECCERSVQLGLGHHYVSRPGCIVT